MKYNSIDFNKLNILVGENGCGKSIALSNISRELIKSEKYENVICIANTTTDKYPRIKSDQVDCSIINLKKNNISKLIKKIIIKGSSFEENANINNLASRALAYINFSSTIIIEFNAYIEYENIVHFKSISYDRPELESDILSIVAYFESHVKYEKKSSANGNLNNFLPRSFGGNRNRRKIKIVDEIILDNSDIRNLRKNNIQLIIKHEELLITHGVIGKISYSLMKRDVIVNLPDLSSGELNSLTTNFYIACNITQYSAIFIDEPENSLHPRWQKNYFGSLLDLYYLFDPIIFSATHSPMIVIGAAEQCPDISIFKIDHDLMEKISFDEKMNIDEAMIDIFGVLTSKSHYFSHKINEIINQYADNKTSKKMALEKINSLQHLGLDNKQKLIIDNIENIMDKVSNNE